MVGTALKDVVRCPKCGGRDIVYSCEPKCCFNHVCADCRSTFEINTARTGDYERGTAIEADEPGSADPTTACASCDGLRLAVLREQGTDVLLICAQCRAVSKMVVENFVPGNF